MSEQLDIFSVPQSEAAKQTAMARVDNAAPAEWKDAAFAAT